MCAAPVADGTVAVPQLRCRQERDSVMRTLTVKLAGKRGASAADARRSIGRKRLKNIGRRKG